MQYKKISGFEGVYVKPGVIIREYRTGDYAEIVRAGYPWKGTIERGVVFDLKLNTLDRMERLGKKFLVAYSPRDEKVVGIVTLKEITSNLWGVWNIFVSQTHRRCSNPKLPYTSRSLTYTIAGVK